MFHFYERRNSMLKVVRNRYYLNFRQPKDMFKIKKIKNVYTC